MISQCQPVQRSGDIPDPVTGQLCGRQRRRRDRSGLNLARSVRHAVIATGIGPTTAPADWTLLRPPQALYQHRRQSGDSAAGVRRVLQLDGLRHVATTGYFGDIQRPGRQCAIARSNPVANHPHRSGPEIQHCR